MSTPATTDIDAPMLAEQDPDQRLATATGRRWPESLPFGMLALLVAFASLAACYATFALDTFMGNGSGKVRFSFNPHIQAILMLGLAALTVYALWRDREMHGSRVPVLSCSTT